MAGIHIELTSAGGLVPEGLTLARLRHGDRLKSIGQLAAALAHDLGSPLNVISGRARLVGKGMLSAEAIPDSMESIERQVNKMAPRLRGLVQFARGEPDSSIGRNVVKSVQAVVELYEPLLGKQGLDCEIEGDEGAETPSPVDAQHVASILLSNALQATSERGSVIRISLSGDEGTSIVVEDPGCGLDSDGELIFRPYYSGWTDGDHAGLGLTVCGAMVTSWGGRVVVDSLPGGGTRVEASW